jgi:hypothetical protein
MTVFLRFDPGGVAVSAISIKAVEPAAITGER